MRGSQLGYRLNREPEKEKLGSYRKPELELMTTFHLREICRREKIIHAAMDQMDKEELIRIIMRFRGEDERLLINKRIDTGEHRVAKFLKTVKISEKTHNISAPAKVVAWSGLDTNWLDGFGVSFREELIGTNALLVSGRDQICAFFYIEDVGGKLFLSRSGEIFCDEANIKNYSVYLLPKEYSEIIYIVKCP